MFNRLITGLAIVSLAGIGSAWAQGQTDARAAQVIDQARKALGGAKLAGVTGLSAAGTYRRTMQDREMSGDLSIDLQMPDRFLRTETMSMIAGDAVVTRETGVNGDQLLQSSKTSGGGPGMVIRMASGEGANAEAQMLRAARADFARHALAFLLAAPAGSELQFTYGGEAQAEDGKADVIDVKGRDGFEARLFVDKESHKPLMLSFKGAAPRIVTRTEQRPGGGRADMTPPPRDAAQSVHLPPPEIVEIQMFFADYRPVDGVLLPHHVARSIGGNPTEEWDVKKFKVNPTFKSDTFQKR